MHQQSQQWVEAEINVENVQRHGLRKPNIIDVSGNTGRWTPYPTLLDIADALWYILYVQHAHTHTHRRGYIYMYI